VGYLHRSLFILTLVGPYSRVHRVLVEGQPIYYLETTMSITLTEGQAAVLAAFNEYGPMTDMALAVYIHHTSQLSMSSSGIRTRRVELQRMVPPLIQQSGFKTAKSGRQMAIHEITEDGATLLNPTPTKQVTNV
jgi:hypothetical protein